MKITNRRYNIYLDFERVHEFLTDTYDKETLNSYLLPQYFEYAHHLQWFDFLRTHRFGLWEESGNIIAIACYEMDMGSCHLHNKKGYEFLLPEMLDWAEQELSVMKDNKRSLQVWITDKEQTKQILLHEDGYNKVEIFPVKIFDYGKPFMEKCLPVGYSLIDGTDIDIQKLSDCWWEGFDHNEPPPLENNDGNIKMMSAPRFRKDLMTIVVAPNDEYACALGMWFDEQHKYAYLEPLATPPKYRHLGLATIALTEAMKKTKALGATYCFGGGPEFYTSIGFEHICNRELWKKEW